MPLRQSYIIAGLLVSIAAPAARGITVTKSRTVDVNSSQLQSPYFTESADGVVTPTPTANGWAPASPTKAGAVTSTTPRGVFAIAGNSTSAGVDNTPGTEDDWQNGNGIPTGLTLNFVAEYTISVGPNAPAGSFLTFPGNLGNPPDNDFGNGLGMTQTMGGVSTLEAGEELLFSPFTISDVSFSGTMAEAGFTVGTPAVSPLSSQVFRSAGFTSASEGALLTRTSDGETVGFGTQTGTLASNVVIANNFNNVFPAQAGPYTFAMTAGNMALKGIEFAYDVSYDINPSVGGDNADFNGDGLVDGADFLIWQQNLALTGGATRAQGNANPTVDGTVDGTDLGVWTAQYGTSPAAVSAAVAVPEPAAAALAAIGLLGAALRRMGTGMLGRRS
jgi:hypothetical protein